MKSRRPKAWIIALLMTASLVLHMAVENAVYGSESRPPSSRILDLYKSGKLTEARQALRKHISGCEKIGTYPIRVWQDAGRLLGGGFSAGLVMRCIELERECNPGGKIPEEVYKAADIVRKATDEGFAAYERVPADIRAKVRQPEETKASSVKAKTELLKLEVAELRRDGREDRAREILAEEADFLAANNIKTDGWLPEVSTTTKTSDASASTPIKLSGRELAIVQLVLAYYEALSAENAAAFDRILLQGPGLKTGDDIVTEIAQEREAEKDFDRIGPVVFDDESSLTIFEKGDGELEVNLSRVLKSFGLGEKVLTQREPDRFRVQVVNGEYKLVIPRKEEEK